MSCDRFQPIEKPESIEDIYSMFSVVVFEDDDCVECVPTTWIEGEQCYWPSSDIKKRIKSKSLPDKDHLSKHKIRKLGHDCPDYETAQRYCKRAEETSNIESEDESRKRKMPSRYCTSESDGIADDENEDEVTRTTPMSKVKLPTPPSGFSSELKNKARNTPSTVQKSAPSMERQDVPQQPSELTPQRYRHDRSPVRRNLPLSGSPLRRSPRSKTNNLSKSTCVRVVTRDLPGQHGQLQGSGGTDLTRRADSSRQSEQVSAGTSLPRQTEVGSTSESRLGLLHQILSKLESMEADVKCIRQSLSITDQSDIDNLDELLPSGEKLNSVEEIHQFEDSIDETKRKKVVAALASLQGGTDGGLICRTVMRAILTNNVMSLFSGTVQKGKLHFIGTPLYKIVLSAARKASKRTIPFESIKAEVLDVLRNAPNKPGGVNYVKKHGNRKRIRVEEFPADSE